ncbi:MAG: hypothetical protein AAF570_13975 [Bacteroidota bacterium]
MSIANTLEKLEDKYYGELEEDRDAVIETLVPMHQEALGKGMDAFREFAEQAMDACGGVYIPHVMWVELAQFIEDESNRIELYNIIAAFVNSGFEETERKKMKSLLITYFALEREFERNKVMTLVVSKAHPDVQEYFRKVENFVAKNKTSVDMYIEKFHMLKDKAPDFALLRMPVIKLKEHLGVE